MKLVCVIDEILFTSIKTGVSGKVGVRCHTDSDAATKTEGLYVRDQAGTETLVTTDLKSTLATVVGNAIGTALTTADINYDTVVDLLSLELNRVYSPDGTEWQITVSDVGIVAASKV